jgi:hypothetical protein
MNKVAAKGGIMGEDGLLQQFLSLLDSGGLHTMDETARQLGVSEALVSAMADNLLRRGYLAALNDSCGTSCGGCPVSSACHLPESVPKAPMMALTAKGRERLKKR